MPDAGEIADWHGLVGHLVATPSGFRDLFRQCPQPIGQLQSHHADPYAFATLAASRLDNRLDWPSGLVRGVQAC
jgi:hypothetical protein